MFYELPLNKDIYEIKNEIHKNNEFIILPSDTMVWEIRKVSAKIKNANTLLCNADSAFLDLYPTWTSFCFGSRRQRETSLLKALQVTLYFESSKIKETEFDTITNLLSKNYNFINYSSSKNDDSLEFEKGVEYEIFCRREFPQIKVIRSVLENDGNYIKIIYYDRE